MQEIFYFFHPLTKWGTVYYISPEHEWGEFLEFVYLAMFERTRAGVLTDAVVKALEDELLATPRAGVVMPGTGGVRKVRAAQQGRGKSGSTRVAYLYVPEQATVYFILAFPKNVQANLTPDQKKQVRSVVAQIKSQDWPRRRPATRVRVH